MSWTLVCQNDTGGNGNQLKFQDDLYYYMLIAGTNGVLDQIRWNVGEHVARGHDQGRWDMKWFVD